MEWKVIFAQSVTVVFSTMLIIFIGARLFSCLSLNPSEHGILTNDSCTVAIGSFKALANEVLQAPPIIANTHWGAGSCSFWLRTLTHVNRGKKKVLSLNEELSVVQL